MKTILICNDGELATFALGSGVSRIMLDWERNGKAERQKGADTLLSYHKVSDLFNVVSSLNSGGVSDVKRRVIVRVNPLYDGSAAEIQAAIDGGAGYIMLPYFHSANQVKDFVEIVDGRASVIALVETGAAVQGISEIVEISGVSEIYIGLNDLHRDLNMRHMFQPLASGVVDHVSKVCLASGKPFGFGGIGRIGTGEVPAEFILAEHRRLGSGMVILSRSFHCRSSCLGEVMTRLDMPREIKAIRDAWLQYAKLTTAELNDYHDKLVGVVTTLTKEM